jgi:hypothetical protein
MLIARLEEIVGREARANPVAADAKAGKLTARSGQEQKKQQDDEAYLGFLARQVKSAGQFEMMIAQVQPELRAAVSLAIWKKLRPEVQALIPDPSGAPQ